jgi:hypothetical protein
MKVLRVGLALGCAALGCGSQSSAWDAAGHGIIAREVATQLSEELPSFFAEGRDQMAWDAVDPDLMRNHDLPQLRDREGPDQYLDLELLADQQLPETRNAFLDLLAAQQPSLGLEQVGSLPYALTDATQRLIFAFAQVRNRPASEHLQAKALIYAAHLAHYAADLSQPLHTTIHHDGRALADLSSPHSGIHQQVDQLIGRLTPQSEGEIEAFDLMDLDPLFPSIVAELQRSHRQVDRLYRLAPELAALASGGGASADLRAFTLERYRAAVRFSASLIRTAWRASESLELPEWGLPTVLAVD